jgi:hypothetical protein
MSTKTCRRGHRIEGANRYKRPNGHTECWACKLRERYADFATKDIVYEPGEAARVKLDELRAIGLWGTR